VITVIESPVSWRSTPDGSRVAVTTTSLTVVGLLGGGAV
jgi:hypothetical protein